MAGRRGLQVERIAKEILERDGYTVHRTVHASWDPRRGPIKQNNDIFGCVDLVGKKKGVRTRWVQVTAGSNIGEKIADLSQVPWDTQFDQVEVWLWKGKRMKDIKAEPGQKRDKFLESQFFQVRSLDSNYVLESAETISAKVLLA